METWYSIVTETIHTRATTNHSNNNTIISKTIITNKLIERKPAKINLIFLGISCFEDFRLSLWKSSQEERDKWWRFINLEICQNLWLFLKNVTRSLSVCSLVHSQYVTAVPPSPRYTPAMITLLRPSPPLHLLEFLQNIETMMRRVGNVRTTICWCK